MSDQTTSERLLVDDDPVRKEVDRMLKIRWLIAEGIVDDGGIDS